MTSDNDIFNELYENWWHFMELYVWEKNSGTLWNFITGMKERNNYA